LRAINKTFKRSQLLCHHVFNSFLVIDQRIHAAKQLLMRQRGAIHLRDADRLQPTQHPKLGVRIAKAGTGNELGLAVVCNGTSNATLTGNSSKASRLDG
jgi:hypothetical protein